MAAILMLVAGGLLCGSAIAENFSLSMSGGRIDVEILAGERTVSDADIIEWVETSAAAVSAYYERFPVEHMRLRIAASRGRTIRGTTWGGAVPFIRIMLGNLTSAETLKQDWRLTHEMVHLAFPELDGRHRWLEEGLATYVEPVARVRNGQLSESELWQRLLEGLPRAVAAGSAGRLDTRNDWANTYWGGALFCLLADIDIRRRSGNRLGLRDALAGVLAAGGDIRQQWSIIHSLRQADDAIGMPALSELYASMATSERKVNLSALWAQLGVSMLSGQVRFDDSAPLAEIRQRIFAQ